MGRPSAFLQPLDYESCERYTLKVAVQNEAPLQAAAPRAERGQARVSVQVRDVNEPPVFRENPLRASLAEGAAPGTPVATFSARDPDTRRPQRLRWGPRLSRGDPQPGQHSSECEACAPGSRRSALWLEGGGSSVCVTKRPRMCLCSCSLAGGAGLGSPRRS